MIYEYHRKETPEFSGTAISLEGLIWPFLETLSSNPNLSDVNIQAMKQAWRITTAFCGVSSYTKDVT